jgi:hypothetical protein
MTQGVPAKERFGQVAVRKGYASERQVTDALDRQRALSHGGAPHRLIGMIMLEMGALGTTELIAILRELNVPWQPPKTERRSLN